MPEWERVRLGEVLVSVPTSRRESVEADKTYSLLGVRLNNEGPFLRETKKGADSSAPSLFRVKSGDFIYSRLFAWRGALGLIPPELDGCYVSNEFPLFTAKDDRIDLDFLNYWFHLPHVIRTVEADCTGSTPLTRNRYKEQYFLALEIPLPPLPKQRRIVARVKGLLDKVEEARGLREVSRLHLENVMPGVIKTVCERLADDAPLAKLADVAVSITDGDHQPPPKSDAGIPFIMISNITTKKLNLFNTKFAPELYFQGLSESRKPKRGDILYSAVGATYGRPCLVDTDLPFCFQRHIAIIRPDPEIAISEYIWWMLQSRDVYRQATSAITGTAQPTVPLKGIRNLTFPLPSKLIQQEIVSRLESYEYTLKVTSSDFATTDAQFKALPASILAQAFAGAL